MTENTTENTTETTKPAELTIVDLQNIHAILDVAARRGAFGAQELSGVGAVVDKLSAFLASVAAAQESTEASSETAAASE